MPAIDDLEHRLGDALRPAIAALAGERRQRREHVELREHGAGRLQPLRAGRRRLAHFDEQLIFEFLGLLVRRKHPLLVFFEFRRDVTLGVLDCLLADVMLGNLVAVSMRHFEIVAEHLVEPDLEARNAGPRDFVGLIAGDPLLTPAGQLAERIEIGVKPAANETAVATGERAVIGQSLFELRPNLGAKIKIGLQPGEQAAFACRKPGLDCGQC